MKKPTGLSVIECNYRESFWTVTVKEDGFDIHDPIEEFQQRRDVDIYHLCGVYNRMNVPVEISEIQYEQYKQYRPYEGVMMNYSDLVCSAIQKGHAVLVSTGYCMYAPAIVGGIQRAIGKDKKIGVVWIDAHSDNRIVEEIQSTSFVGIPISAIVGQTFPEWRKTACGLEIPCEGQNVIASDIRICDEHSMRNMENAGIIHLTSSDFENVSVWKKAIQDLAKRVDAIYLSVDMDILKNEFTPAYIKNVPGGHTTDTVMRNIRIVMETNKALAFSVFCADFDRYEQQGEWTYYNAMKLIASGLGNWANIPLDEDS